MIQIKERGINKQLAINMFASMVTFAVGLGIRFGLTPYIVRTLGPEAYGFVGLASNILSYTGLITVALNSMAGRFITINYVEGHIDAANKYFSSVFFSNIILAFIILLFSIGCVIWLEYLINIPNVLIFDVKLLFSLLALNNVIGLVANVWCTATFIKNRLDLSNIQGIIGNLLNATILICLFSCFAPHIWYMGAAGLVLTIYTVLVNKKFSTILTPELKINRANYDFTKVVELLKSGMWNLISKLGDILGQGLDLLIANLCIGSIAMGYFAMTKNVPFLILSLFSTISGVFSPMLTSLYAENKIEELLNEFFKSIRILSFIVSIPLACLYVYGDSFYHLWLPTEDSSKLQMLTVLGTFALPFTLPLESLWNIFTITNKLKYSTLFMLGNNIIVFGIVMFSMLVTDLPDTRLVILACTRSLVGIVRGIVFLPLYGAYCLGVNKWVFFNILGKSIVCQALCIGICFCLRWVIDADTWMSLILAGLLISLICLSICSMLILTKNDRKVLKEKLLRIHA